MKKVFDQTFRDIRREVNKKVLKVPGIEQKVLDATSNEPWGPHGSLLADIAQASRNYHEYQMIMVILWKRISDTGKNWRHVYKALTILEYLVGHGSERVVDEIRERSYQLSTLSDFQYIDSSGRDQGNNVRKKSQSLVALVNDKERIIEARQKAAANRDKFRAAPVGGMYRPGSYNNLGGYGERFDYDRYGGRDDDRYSYGREREYSYRDDERYSRDGDRNSRDFEERYGREGQRTDDFRGRSRSVDHFQNGSRSRSSDRGNAIDDDVQSSSRGLERKFSEPNIGVPPSYEEAVSESRSPVHSERDGETSAVPAPGASPTANNNTSSVPNGFVSESSPPQGDDTFDEFDPRGPFSGASPPVSAPTVVTPTAPGPAASGVPPNVVPKPAEMDLLGSLADVFSSNPLAIVPVTSSEETGSVANYGQAPSFSVSQSNTQSFEDPFGETPFKATTTTDANEAKQYSNSASLQPAMNQSAEFSQPPALKGEVTENFAFGDSFSAASYSAPSFNDPQASSNAQLLSQELSDQTHEDTDILAGILPPSGPQTSLPSQKTIPGSAAQTSQANGNTFGGYDPQSVSFAQATPNIPGQTPFGQVSEGSSWNYPAQGNAMGPTAYGATPFGGGDFRQQGFVPNVGNQITQSTEAGTQLTGGNLFEPPVMAGPPGSQHASDSIAMQINSGGYTSQPVFMVPTAPQANQQNSSGTVVQHGHDVLGNMFSHARPTGSTSQHSLSSSTGALVTVIEPSKEKFEPKSAVWADTLSRGLVNLNISGPKANPLADIGVDFDAINRKEKRLEKPVATPAVSNVTMGKAMGSGSGLGRSSVGTHRPPPSPIMGSGVGRGMGSAPGAGMGMGGGYGGGYGGYGGGYGGMNQPHGMGMGMGMGMGINMGGGQGYQMQPRPGMGPGGPAMPPVGYNPMMGPGNYNPQQPYGGYR